MQHLLEEKLFPFVIKPGRYIGGELGHIVKSADNRLKVAMGYPDMYEIGMSYLGLQILYNIINSDDRFLCERFFAPDRDAEEILRHHDIPYFSLESFRPLNQFDIIGFTLAYEMVYTNLLNILDLSKIPLKSTDRTDEHPLIIAGGPVVHNPEPSSAFIDLYYIGEAEENLPKILEIIRDSKNLNRRQKLERVAEEVSSVYIPQFYNESTGHTIVDFTTHEIKSYHAGKLRSDFYPAKPLVPFIETVHDRLSVEIMRGCPWACRFCQATAIYRPVRVRPMETIIKQIYEQLGQTGYNEVSLLSLSSSDYPDIIPLTMQLARELHKKRLALSLPSLRPGTFSQELANAVKMTRKTGLTFAPEAGTERLRSVIRKDISDQQLYDTIELVFKNDWNLVKLYFMIGLPTETDEDIEGIIRMIGHVEQIGQSTRGRKVINVTISPFSPKPHTPFQWDQQPSPEYIRKKQSYIRKRIKSPRVNLKLRDPNLSFLEGIIGRGGRELTGVIESAFKSGARFDGWGESFNFDLWLKAFQDNGLDPYDYLKGYAFSDELPWSKIHLHVSPNQLMKDRNRTSEILGEKVKPVSILPGTKTDNNADYGFGRTKKKVIQRAQSTPITGNVRIKWGRKGLVRFLSHRDNMRVFERAIRRAELPVSYSQGFHPHMKFSFGPPLTLGFTSEAEYLDLTLEVPFQSDMVVSLSRELPEGYFIAGAKPIINTRVSLSGRLNRAVYLVEIHQNSDFKTKIDLLLSREKIEISRFSKGTTKIIDIRPALYEIKIIPFNKENSTIGSIYMELGIGNAGYARPSEIFLAAELVNEQILPTFVFHRRELLYIDDDGNRFSPMEF